MKTQNYELLEWQTDFILVNCLMAICQNGKDQAESSKLLTLEITSNKNSDTFVFFSLNETWNVQGFTVKSDSDEDILQLHANNIF